MNKKIGSFNRNRSNLQKSCTIIIMDPKRSPLLPKQDIYCNGLNVFPMRRDVYFNWEDV